jgi:enediyne biosynthesis protein E4
MKIGKRFIHYHFHLMVVITVGLLLGVQTSPNFAVPVAVETLPLTENQACSGAFIAHDLDHISSVPGGEKVRMFEANGGGVGINDLDNDGDLDIVLANHAGLNTILWNEGQLNFRTETMIHGDSRAITLVDVDGDTQIDIVASRTNRAPTYWHNDGDNHFSQQFLGGVGKPLYSINWADLDNDGDLDLVGATYDASLLTDYGQDFLTSGNGGVYYYENRDGQFHLNTLATTAQGLALALLDLNNDGHLDIWVGNDFALPDYTWYWTETGWQPGNIPASMSYSTMSLDFGDVNNDGENEIFSTDMKPFADNSDGETVLRGIIDGINADPRPIGDTQITANVLQSVDSQNVWTQTSPIDATGWSWSGKFGDLDQDGFLDLYVVNGFIEISTFAQLPDHELVEENRVFRNRGDGQFEPVLVWGLGSLRSGRGMSMADLDDDGDLDIVINNLRATAQLFENQLCQGRSLQVDLQWPESGNTQAIGAQLILSTDRGTYYREVKAASGYLSGDPSRTHFGFPDDAQLQQLQIEWPDGAASTVEELIANTRILAKRDQ